MSFNGATVLVGFLWVSKAEGTALFTLGRGVCNVYAHLKSEESSLLVEHSFLKNCKLDQDVGTFLVHLSI